MIQSIVISQLGVSTSWRDYVPLVLLVTLGPIAVWGLRKLWRSIPEKWDEPVAGNATARRKKRVPPKAQFKVVEIATFTHDMQADSACAMLKSAGIPAFIRRDDCGGMRPWLRVATGGLRIAVRDADAERATSLLRKAMG